MHKHRPPNKYFVKPTTIQKQLGRAGQQKQGAGVKAIEGQIGYRISEYPPKESAGRRKIYRKEMS